VGRGVGRSSAKGHAHTRGLAAGEAAVVQSMNGKGLIHLFPDPCLVGMRLERGMDRHARTTARSGGTAVQAGSGGHSIKCVNTTVSYVCPGE